MQAFISYSHRDQIYLDNLHTHLSMLRRERFISTWFDRDILAGGDIDDEVDKHLAASGLFLALVSPDFLHSDYCYDVEMTAALARHNTGDIRVVPIIVRPCDWKHAPFSHLKVLPKDGKPVSTWADRDEAFLDIVSELRRLLRSPATPKSAPEHSKESAPHGTASAIRIRKDFDEIDRGNYVRAAFDEIQAVFQTNLSTLGENDGIKTSLESISTRAFSCTIINQHLRRGAAYLTVRARGSDHSLGDITYSFSAHAPENTANGWFHVLSDGYELMLEGGSFSGESKAMRPADAASHMWHQLLDQAGIDA